MTRLQNCQLSLCTGAKYTFTIKEGADGKNGRISVNYDGFIDDVSVNDMLLVDECFARSNCFAFSALGKKEAVDCMNE